MQEHLIQNLLRTFDRLGRTTRNTVVIEDIEQANGEMTDKETRSLVINGNVEITEITHNRVLDCGHIASATSIHAECDFCHRLVCEKCLFVCATCHLHACHHCCKTYSDNGVEKILCTTCHWYTTRKDKASKVFRFFVKPKEGQK